MNTPADVKFHREFRLVAWRPQGVLDQDILSKIIAFIDDEEQGPDEPFDRFVDLSCLSAIELDFEYVVRVSMHRRHAYAGHEPVKSALLATTPDATRLAKLHATLTEGTPLQVGVFSELETAAEWLGVPSRVLMER